MTLPPEPPTATGEDERLALLRESSLLRVLSAEDLAAVAERLGKVRVPAGETIIQEGQPGDLWYLLRDGQAAVVRRDLIGQEVTLATFDRGDGFGEAALIADQPRTATICAVTDVEAYTLSREDFRRLAETHPTFSETVRQHVDLLGVHTFLKRASPFARFKDDAIWNLVRKLQPRRARPGETIIQEGDEPDRFYLVRSGRVEVVRRGKAVAELGPGNYFGEVALLASEKRTATVRAVEDTELLGLSRPDFEEVLREHGELRNMFREVVSIRFHAAPGQPLLLPDPLTTVMPFVPAARRRRYWMVLLAGAALFAVLTFLAELSGQQAAVYAALAVGSFVGPVVFVMYLSEANLLADRPGALVLTFVLAAALGLPLAIFIQRSAGLAPGSFTQAFLVASVEETAKLLGLAWLVRLRNIRFQMDGVIYGAAAGMGFAAFESALYGLARVETVGALLTTLWMRALLSPFTHGTWTAISSAVIVRERSTGLMAGWWRIALALGAAIILHTCWNWRVLPGPLNILWLLVVGVVSVLLLRTIVQRAAREESASILAFGPELAGQTVAGEGLRCGNCGQVALAGMHYCPRCGAALTLT